MNQTLPLVVFISIIIVCSVAITSTPTSQNASAIRGKKFVRFFNHFWLFRKKSQKTYEKPLSTTDVAITNQLRGANSDDLLAGYESMQKDVYFIHQNETTKKVPKRLKKPIKEAKKSATRQEFTEQMQKILSKDGRNSRFFVIEVSPPMINDSVNARPLSITRPRSYIIDSN